MDSKNQFVVYPPRTRFVGLVGAAILMTLISFFVVTSGPLFMKMVGILGCGMFGFGAIYLLYRLFVPSPSIVIDSRGIADHSAAITFGFLEWSQIERVVLSNFMGQRMLMIVPNDIDRFIASATKARASLWSTNMKLIKAPFAIAEQNISVSLDDLVNEMGRFHPGIRVERQG